MKMLVENIWKMADYFRGYMDSESILDLNLACIYLFKNHPELIKDIDEDQQVSISFDQLLENLDDEEGLNSYSGIDSVIQKITILFTELDNSNHLKNVFSSLTVFQSLEQSPKAWYQFFKFFSPLTIEGVSLKSLSNEQYDKIFLEVLDRMTSNKRYNLFTTPKSLGKLYKSIVANPSSVYDPAAGLGNNLVDFAIINRSKCYGVEINQRTWALSKLRLSHLENMKLNLGNSFFESDQSEKFESVICTPPFGAKLSPDHLENKDFIKFGTPPRSNADLLWLQLCLHKLTPKGTALVTLGANSVFATNKSSLEIRRNLLNEGKVKAIISLPSGLFSNTGIKTVVWVISQNNNPSNGVLVIDSNAIDSPVKKERKISLSDRVINVLGSLFSESGTDSHFLDESSLRRVSLDEIAENNYDLSPERYLISPELKEIDFTNSVKLESVIVPNSTRFKSAEGKIVKRITPKAISNSGDSIKLDISECENIDGSKLGVYHEGGRILLSKRGKINPKYIDKKEGYLFEVKDIHSFQVDESKVLIDFLTIELNREYVQLQIDKYSKGAIIASISKADLLKIRINIPSIEEQRKLVGLEKELRNNNLVSKQKIQDTITNLNLQWKKNLGSKKHNILQPLNNIALQIEVLLDWIELNNGVVDFNKDFSFDKGVTPLKNLENIKYSLTKSIEYAENLTHENDFGIKEMIDISEKIQNHMDMKAFPKNVHFSTTGLEDNKVTIIQEDGETINVKPIVEISNTAIEQIVNNIYENAINHGFINHEKRYDLICDYQITANQNKDGYILVISFLNNGKPFPKGMGTLGRFITQGEKAGETGNTGEGGARVYELVKYFGGTMEIKDAPENEFPVEIKLLFPLKLNDEEL